MKLWSKIVENTAQALKPFMNGRFVRISTEDKGNSCLEQKQVFANGRLNRNAVAQQDDDMAENLQDRLYEKVQSFVAFPREAYESPVKIIPPSQLYLFMVPKRLGHDWRIFGHGVHHRHNFRKWVSFVC